MEVRSIFKILHRYSNDKPSTVQQLVSCFIFGTLEMSARSTSHHCSVKQPSIKSAESQEKKVQNTKGYDCRQFVCILLCCSTSLIFATLVLINVTVKYLIQQQPFPQVKTYSYIYSSIFIIKLQ